MVPILGRLELRSPPKAARRPEEWMTFCKGRNSLPRRRVSLFRRIFVSRRPLPKRNQVIWREFANPDRRRVQGESKIRLAVSRFCHTATFSVCYGSMDRPMGRLNHAVAILAVLGTSVTMSAITLRPRSWYARISTGPSPPGARTRQPRLSDHESRTHDQGAHGGSGCEFFRLVSGAGGTFVHLVHDLAPARVIAELKPSVWVRSDRPGIQLRARVVFPRSINPTTNQPDSVLIAGTSYTPHGELGSNCASTTYRT